MTALLTALLVESQRAVRRIELHSEAARVLDGTASGPTLAQYYVSAYETVQHAQRYLTVTRDHLRATRGALSLIELFELKCVEEDGHHHWLAADLDAIGFPLGGPTTPRPSRAAHSYVVFHDEVVALCPLGFLGTAWVLESLALHCGGRAAKELQARCGDPPSAGSDGLKFLTSHHEADEGHVAEMGRILDFAEISDRDQDYIVTCARFTATVYADFFGDSSNPVPHSGS